MSGRPANAVLGLILTAGYEGAVRAYRALPAPRPVDDRWGAYAIFCAQDALEAKDLLVRAVARGEQAARIELATVERHLGRLSAAQACLQALVLSKLDAFDTCLARRELGAIALSLGKLPEAVEHLEAAWAIASGDPWSAALKPQVAQLLGFVLSQQGLGRQAVHYLDQAVRLAQPGRRAYPLIARALALVYDARFEQAERDLTLLGAGPALQPNAGVLRTFVLGELRRSQGRWREAREALESAVRLARAAADPQAEFHALLALSSVLCAQGELNDALGAISRAEALAGDDRDRAFLNLRRGSWRLSAGGDGERDLQGALQGFRALPGGREAAWSLVQLARSSLGANHPAQACKHLEDAVSLCQGLGGSGVLVSELRLAPAVADFIAAQPENSYVHWGLAGWRASHGVAPSSVRLLTLGRESLVVDDHAARLTLRRTIEILVYVLAHPGLTLERLLAALWPDEAPRRASSYFHQTRHQLAKAVPGLAISFDGESRTYRVSTSGFDLFCDYTEVKRLLSTESEDGFQQALELYRGPFLDSVDTQWARLERETMEWSMVRSGLGLIERWVSQGDYAKSLSLSERLLEIEPLNDALAEYLITSTRELRGVLAARRVLDSIAKRYREEVGAVPDGLTKLGVRLAELN